MSLPKPEPLCRYRYDPLDRLASCLPLGQPDTRCFYRLNKLTTEIQGQIDTSWFQAGDRLLGQHQQNAGKNARVLIATDTPGSVIHALGADQPHAFGYTPYGTRAPTQAPLHLPGFNGERRDPVTWHYLLGNGYRAFNPVLMRFNSPDSLSPFGEGGLNAYAYCVGDPVNQVDPSGHVLKYIRAFLSWLLPKKTPITTRFTPLGDGLIAYEKLTGKTKTLIFSGHGSDNMMHGYHPIVTLDLKARTPEDILRMAEKSDIRVRDYKRLTIQTCNSATGENSFAKMIWDKTGIPTKGYIGEIIVDGPMASAKELAGHSRKIRKLSNGEYEYQGGIRVHKKNPYYTFMPNARPFAYRPVKFGRS